MHYPRVIKWLLLMSLLAGCIRPEAPSVATSNQPAAGADQPQLTLATTTSTQDSGLLDVILPDFEQKSGAKVAVVAVGTGQALKLGADGNADVLLVHACAQEEDFMAAGHGVRRQQVMYNDFVILGNAADPAKIQGSKDAATALQQIAAAQAKFVSRGDKSGTHIKEMALWATSEITPTGDWYISAGQGMGAVLTMANELQAYTLSDRATYLKRTLEGTDLKIMVEGDKRLLNPYSVITVNPAKSPQIHAELANTFADWILSPATQTLIGQYGVKEFGTPLFTPTAAAPVAIDCQR